MIEKQSGVIHPNTVVEFVEDFLGGVTGTHGWTSTSSGTGAQVTQSALGVGYTARSWGGVTAETGTTTTGSAYLALGSVFGWLGLASGDRMGLDMRINVPALSTVSQEFIARFGIWDRSNSGLFFEYDRLNSANWRLRAGDGTLQTTTSSTAVATGMKKYGIRATSAGAEFFVDDVSIGTVTSHIAGGATVWGTPILHIIASAGTTTKLIHADYFAYRLVLAAGR